MAKAKAKNKNVQVGIVSKLKKQPKHKLAFLAVAAFLLVTSIGYAGFGYFQSRNLIAKAGGWTTINSQYATTSSTPRFAGCKTSTNTPYGTVWRVSIVATRPNTTAVSFAVNVMRNGQVVSSSSGFTNAWMGNIALVNAMTAPLAGDRLTISWQSRTAGYGFVTNYNPALLTTC